MLQKFGLTISIMSAFNEPADIDSRSLDGDRKWSLQPLLRSAERSHSKMPGIRKIPLRAIGIIAFIALLNIIVWVAAAIVLVCFDIGCVTLD